jgi:hypothetical protein
VFPASRQKTQSDNTCATAWIPENIARVATSHEQRPNDESRPMFQDGFLCGEVGWDCYGRIRYVRSPASFFVDSTFRPIFFPTCALRNPRMLWFCQSVALAISAKRRCYRRPTAKLKVIRKRLGVFPLHCVFRFER